MRVVWTALAGVGVAAILAGGPAHAAWVISASGTWGANAPVTGYSAPNETFSFSFDLPSQTFTTIYQDANISVTTQMYGVTYTLNGVNVPVTVWTGAQGACSGLAVGTLCNVAFFDSTLNGGLALAFSDHSIEFFGSDIGSTGTLNPGHYSFTADVDDTGGSEGTALGSVVPEPATWTLMLAGVASLGALARTARRRPALA